MPNAPSHFYHLVPSPFGELGIVWREEAQGPRVQQIFLPKEFQSKEKKMHSAFGSIAPGSSGAIEELSVQIRAFLEGEPISFGLEQMAMGTCSPFQRKVLLTEYGIPRGQVSTYARIARSVGRPRAARAVGSALARNPFPIIIPCHRAVRSNGTLGDYQGGLAMKRALLEMEGVFISGDGKIVEPRFFY